jgi:hypothetical protein
MLCHLESGGEPMARTVFLILAAIAMAVVPALWNSTYRDSLVRYKYSLVDLGRNAWETYPTEIYNAAAQRIEKAWEH